MVLIFLPARRISVNLDVGHGQRAGCVPLGHSSLYLWIAGYVTLTSVTVDKQSNGRRIEIEVGA